MKPPPQGYGQGWTIRYVTDLTAPVWFYVRGEEYSAQVAGFVEAIAAGRPNVANSFTEAARTDRAIEMIKADAAGEGVERERPAATRKRGLFAFGR